MIAVLGLLALVLLVTIYCLFAPPASRGGSEGRCNYVLRKT